MTARPRTTCPVCHKDRAVNQDGRIGAHPDPTGRSASEFRCDGVGRPTTEDVRRAELKQLAGLVRRYPEEARGFVAWLP